MNKNKVFHIIASVLLVMLVNTLVNLSDNLWLGLRHSEIYFALVVPGLIGSITIQIYGAYKLLEYCTQKYNELK